MGRINFGRVLLGGLVAGIIINLGELLLNGVVLRSQMEADFKRMNLARPGASLIALAVSSTFVMGIVAVFIYAMIRSRLGPGPRTAIVAALLIWFLVYAYSGTFNLMMISIPPKIILMALGWGLVEYFVGILAGAALYRET